MYRGIVLIAAGLAVLCLSISFCIVQSNNNLDSKPCWPVMYPESTKPLLEDRELYSFTTNSSVEEVISFYSESLKAVPINEFTGEGKVHWVIEKIDPLTFLYSCVDVSNFLGLTAERGCIYVREENMQTIVALEFSIWADDPLYCDLTPELSVK